MAIDTDSDNRHRPPQQDGAGPSFADSTGIPQSWLPVVSARNSAFDNGVAPPARGPWTIGLRLVGARMAELLNVCAAYLGIAVLVTVAVVFTIAPLREQARQIHQSLLMSLRPQNVDNVLYAMLAGHESNRQLLEGLAGTGTYPSGGMATHEGEPGGAATSSADAINFVRLLRASENGRVAGITPAQERALRGYIARKFRIASSVAGALVSTAFVVAREMELDPQLILAVIAIESRYNPYAESHVGAQGLMQVMTRVHKEKFTEFADGTIAALHPIANMRVGSRILRDCIDRRGSVERGLACYVGATGPSDGGYGAKVLAERRRMALASGIPVGR